METLTNSVSSRQQAIAIANKKKKRKARLAAEPNLKITHTKSFGNKTTLSKYQRQGLFKKNARGTVTISDKAMHRLGMY